MRPNDVRVISRPPPTSQTRSALRVMPRPRLLPPRILLCLALASLLHHPSEAAAATPGDWPQWRGPLGNGASPDAKPPLRWSETEGVRWKFAIPGLGTSTPIVWKDLVFVLTAVPSGTPVDPPPAPAEPSETRPRSGRPTGGARGEQPSRAYQFKVLAIDRASGRLRWEQTAREVIPHEGHHRDHGFASFSPVTDGARLYVHFGSRGLHAYDLNGRRLWEKDLGRMSTRNGFGEGSSPALHGNTLVVLWDHEGEDFIAAFDTASGRELWRQPRDEPTTWTTPLIVEHGGKAQVVVPATGKVRSYDLLTGTPLWEVGGMTANVIPTAVAMDDLVFPISGFRGAALLAIRLGHTGNLGDSDAIAWKLSKGTPYVPSPLLWEGRLYFHSGNNGILSSVEARTGRLVLDAERIEGLNGVYASPVAADGRIYLTGRDGKTVVVAHGDSLRILATNALDDEFDASPALAGTDLFLRGHRHLYALAQRP